MKRPPAGFAVFAVLASAACIAGAIACAACGHTGRYVYALYAAAVIATLLIGCAAFESLIGFFVGLIFIVGGIFLCILQNRYLRFQLTQNDFESGAINGLLHALSKNRP